MRIAVDAMGGDYAPRAVVEGAVEAAREFGVGIVLVGDQSKVEAELARLETGGLDVQVKHASQVVEMNDSASVTLRKKKDASVRVATELVKSGEAVAVISAGHTGAAMATAFFVLGTVKGVDRPAIAAQMPNVAGSSLLLDVGANVDCKPFHLLQFAVMGDVYIKKTQGMESPRVGLLSIGEEDTKGNELTRETFKLLKASRLNFIGNVEGRDVFNGKADIVVCDGFIGNVALKISEGLAEAMSTMLKREIEDYIAGQVGYMLLKPAFRKFKKRIDYSEYGGAPLLGTNGICMISHGSSSAKAIKNAVRAAKEQHANKVNSYIRKEIETYMAVQSADGQTATPREGALR